MLGLMFIYVSKMDLGYHVDRGVPNNITYGIICCACFSAGFPIITSNVQNVIGFTTRYNSYQY